MALAAAPLVAGCAAPAGPTPMTGIYVTGNRFGRHSVDQCPILVSTKTILSADSGNVGTTRADRSRRRNVTIDHTGSGADVWAPAMCARHRGS